MLYHIESKSNKLGHFRWSGLFSYQTTGTNRDGINYLHLSSDRKRMATPSIFSKSTLLELFSQATFPQCYITHSHNLTNWVISDGLDFFPINKPEQFVTESTTCISPRTGNAWIIPLSLPNRIFWNFSHEPHFHNA